MKEAEIRSRDIQDRYLALCESDAQTMLAHSEVFERVPCPFCASDESSLAFEKQGYSYDLCNDCASLFLNPRPSAELLESVNNESPSARFWAEEFYPGCVEKRRGSVYAPRALFVRELETRYQVRFDTIVDVGCGYGVFPEELQKAFPDRRVLGIEPSEGLAAVCEEKGLSIIKGMAAEAIELKGQADFCSCFEVIEHVPEPAALLGELKDLCRPGAVVYLNTLCCDGFDIQVMWERHRNIYPVNHINIPSIHGLRVLFRRCGFSDVEITTPGKLDVDIIRSQLPEELQPRFLRNLYQRGDEKVLGQLQQFLADNGLSSHAWIVARFHG